MADKSPKLSASSTQPASSPAAASPKAALPPCKILQVLQACQELPKADETWSSWYREAADQFLDFISFDVTDSAGNSGIARSGSSHRPPSVRRISGQFEEEVLKSWEEDWEDEDVEDTFDAVMGRIGRYEASRAATTQK